MAERFQQDDTHRGPLAWFARNRVAANLLMVLVLAGGTISMLRMRMEVFPEIDTGRISVRVPYLGASPQEVEEGVLLRVEDALAGIEGIEEIRSVAVEGMGNTVAVLEEYANTAQVLRDVEAAVDRIDTFPEETEQPVVREVTNRTQVLSVVLYGEAPERTLKELADRVREDLTAKPNVSQVELFGLRPYEVSIEVAERALRRHGLSFGEVADAVRSGSVDLPGGSVETPGGTILVRTKGQRYTADQFERIIVLSESDGTVVRLGEIANVVDGFEETDTATYYDGQRAAILNVFRVGEQDAIGVAETVKAYVAEQRDRGLLPEGVKIDTWFDRSRYLQERIGLLTRNAQIGLVLVFLGLLLFLDLRLAFWTTLGIPISFMGAFWLLPQVGVTINMISLFAFIVVLGIVVDDAIVVGENIFSHHEREADPLRAAVRGVREMAVPVTFAILTTVVAFTPLLFTAGQIGKITRVIPIVVISVLLISLVEALLILPAHLSTRHRRGRPGPLARLQQRVRRGLRWVIHKPYWATLQTAVRWRYVTVAVALAAFGATAGFVAGGHIEFVFFPKVDADNVVAELTMPQGTPVAQTQKATRRLEGAAKRVRRRLDEQRTGGRSIVRHVSTTIGQQPFKDIVSGAAQTGLSAEGGGGQSHVAEVNIELMSAEYRTLSSERVADLWREETGRIAGASSLEFVSSFFSTGDAVNVRLSHPDFEKLLEATGRLKGKLEQYEGVTDITDSFLPGERQMNLELTDRGRMAGLTLDDLARQVRAGFYGAEAQRIQRGRHEVKVMVRYPEPARRSLADIESMRIRTPDGTEVPFETVAEVEMGRGYAAIDRADRRRIISVTADVDEAVANANRINGDLAASVLPALREAMPGLNYSFEGQQAEQGESLRSLALNFLVALAGIFVLLGVQFRSYVQPLIVMSAIPFGLIGAVGGHVLMGMNLSFLSGFGVVALTGVVVNDSLIMIDLINRRRARSGSLRRVILDSGARRFRPILLTTVTTFLGLTPMLLEQSLQARFLVPMAVSLAFGVLFATAITLILVPTLYMILEDAHGAVVRSVRWAVRGPAGRAAESPAG